MPTALDVPEQHVSGSRDAGPPERLTVLGVDPRDSRLSAELGRYVPASADAIYRLSGPPSALSRAMLSAFLRNPPATTGVLLRGWWGLRRSGSAAAAIDVVVDARGLAGDVLDVAPLAGVREQGALWTAAAWLASAVAVGPLVSAALQPGIVTGLIAIAGIGLCAAFVLAHSGASIQYRDGAILTAALTRARERGHDHPVVVVPRRHAPGIADRAEDAQIATEFRTVGTDLVAGESPY